MFDIQIRARLGGLDSTDLQLILVDPAIEDILAEIADATPAATGLATAWVASYANPLVFDRNTVIGDLTPSAYPGYATQGPLVWTGPGYDDAGNLVLVADLPVPFVVTGDPLGELLAGLYLTNGTGGDLIGGATIDPPVPLVNGLLIPVTVVIQLGNSG